MRLLTLILLLFSANFVAESSAPCGNYIGDDLDHIGTCDDAKVDPKDIPSLQRGAQIYMNYCLGCHSLKYSRYKRVAEDLDIPLELFKENLIFGDQKLILFVQKIILFVFKN